MEKFITVKEAAERLHLPVETVHSWIMTGILHETEDEMLSWDQFVEQLESSNLKDVFFAKE